MKIVISSVTNKEDELEMMNLRKEVFENELGIVVDCLSGLPQKQAQHLLVRTEPHHEVVASLSIVDTSDNDQLHGRYGLNFASQVRVARYTQLAVARPYRGLGIPLMLILEANRHFVAAGRFNYTWLLYKAERAAVSSFCQLLAFVPSDETFQSEYGDSRILLRNESTAQSKYALCKAEQYLGRLFKSSSLSVRSELDACTPAQQPPALSTLNVA